MTAAVCALCGGRGHRVIAAICDAQLVRDQRGRQGLSYSWTFPIVVPCVCAFERAARRSA